MLVLASTATDCVSIAAFVSLVCVPVGIKGSAVGLKICAITAGIQKYKSIIKEKKKKHDEIALLGKTKLISHDEFVSANDVLREYNEMKEGIKNILKLLWNTLYKYG